MEVKIRTPKVTDHLYVIIGKRATKVPIETFLDDQLREMAKEYGEEMIDRAFAIRTRNGEGSGDA